jgi:hypothetical protein
LSCWATGLLACLSGCVLFIIDNARARGNIYQRGVLVGCRICLVWYYWLRWWIWRYYCWR